MKFNRLLFALLFVSFTLKAQIEPIDTDGDGSRNISTLEHLRWVSENKLSWTDDFELDNDIYAGDSKNWNDSEGFSPIGNEIETEFSGKFDGHYFAIDSLYINRPYQHNVGLFGFMSGDSCIIQNIAITNCEIRGGFNIGGLVGKNRGRYILHSYSTGNISGNAFVGGLVGWNSLGTVEYCFSEANVISIDNKYGGGLVGYNNTTVSNCYSLGKVTGIFEVGGLVGDNRGDIFNSYSLGKVTGVYDIGGLVGINIDGNIRNSFWDIQTSEIDSSARGIGKTTEEMKTKSTFTNSNWNFDEIWTINPELNNGYPSFIWKHPVSITEKISSEKIKISTYPNPANDYLKILISDCNKIITTIYIYDINGKPILNKQINSMNNEILLSTQGIPTGIYNLVISTNTKIFSSKFVKE